MIKHEIAIDYTKNKVLLKYIAQQQKKDKLLRLYKDGWECGFISDEDMEEIKQLEGELE